MRGDPRWGLEFRINVVISWIMLAVWTAGLLLDSDRLVRLSALLSGVILAVITHLYGMWGRWSRAETGIRRGKVE